MNLNRIVVISTIIILLFISVNIIVLPSSSKAPFSSVRNEENRVNFNVPDYEQKLDNFIINKGQIWNEDILFYTEGHGFRAGFMQNGMMVTMGGEEGRWAYNISFANSKYILPIGIGELKQISNYIYTDDPNNWISEVNHFDRVVYYDLYEYIDLEWYIKDGFLKYTLKELLNHNWLNNWEPYSYPQGQDQ